MVGIWRIVVWVSCLLGAEGASLKRRAAFYPGLDNVLKAGFDKSPSYAKYNITVLYSGPNAVGSATPAYPHGSALLVEKFNHIMVCDYVIFTAHDKFTDIYAELDAWRASYAQYQSLPTCLFNINSESAYPIPLTKAQSYDRHLERYRSALILNYLIEQALIITSDQRLKPFPWVMYLDSDIAFTNKYLSIQSVLSRVEQGLHIPTAEQRVCGPTAPIASAADPSAAAATSAPPFSCLPDTLASSPPSLDEVAFVVAPEANCFDLWGINSGSWIYKPSRMSSVIFTAVLNGYRTGAKHKFFGYDQGYLNWVLEELFGFKFGRLRNFCLPYDDSYWTPSIEGNELLFTRAAQAGPIPKVISDVLNFYFPNKDDLAPTPAGGVPGVRPDGRPSEARVAVYVNPRWINTPGCPWVMAHPQRSKLTWKPGDFVVHFNSCSAAGFHTPEFRALADRAAKGLIPHPIDYNWDERWMAEAKPFVFVKKARLTPVDPPGRYWENKTLTH